MALELGQQQCSANANLSHACAIKAGTMGKRKQPEPSSEVADEPVTLSVGQQVAHIKNRQKRSEEYGKLKHKKQVRCRQLNTSVPAWPQTMLWVTPSPQLHIPGDACRRRSASGVRNAGQTLLKQSSSGWSRRRSKSPGSVGASGPHSFATVTQPAD